MSSCLEFCGADTAVSGGDSMLDEDSYIPVINPASGFPMVHGFGGVDVAGNLYGTSHEQESEASFVNDDTLCICGCCHGSCAGFCLYESCINDDFL